MGRRSGQAAGQTAGQTARALLAFLLVTACFLGTFTGTARASASTPGGRALDWAEAHALNAPYAWGGTGPAYDCSGLVVTAIGRADGIWLPHSTAAMVSSPHLVRVASPQRGDLAMWGSPAAPYHVEFVTAWRGWGFGAETYGWAGRVTWHSWAWFAPSSYWRLR